MCVHETRASLVVLSTKTKHTRGANRERQKPSLLRFLCFCKALTIHTQGKSGSLYINFLFY